MSRLTRAERELLRTRVEHTLKTHAQLVDDDAVLFGPGGISASELAYHAGTINYEILTGVQKRVQRIYVEE